MSKHDFFGVPINIGDTVAFCAPNYRHLTLGVVINITNQKVRVQYLNTWNFPGNGKRSEYLALPTALIVKPTPHSAVDKTNE